jgi:hydroxymethylbilane synthase
MRIINVGPTPAAMHGQTAYPIFVTIQNPIRIGSRGSQLALWQANHIADQLRANGHAVEIEVIRTTGDRMADPNFVAPEGLSPNGTGIFIKEIEDALAAGRIDLAVHSLKDLPTQIDPRFTLAAIPPRADARDAFVCENHWGFHMLPSGSTIATTSPRRQAMLLALRPDITFVEMRGNIDTRLRKWYEGAADALVLASAGLDRLGRTEHVHQRFSIDEVTPAPGQGALALQVRSSLHGRGSGLQTTEKTIVEEGALAPDGSRDATIHDIIRTLNDPATEYATQAERAVLHALGGGCQLPLGAYCHQSDDHWHLHAMVASPDGEEVAHVIQRVPIGTAATDFGQFVAEALISRGALQLLANETLASAV